MNRKAQITIFAILAILIIAAIALIFTLYQRNFDDRVRSQQEESEEFLDQCINEHVESAIEKITGNIGALGGDKLHFEYQYRNITYLCYTGLPLSRCTIQIPALISKINQEIEEAIEPEINNCFNALKEDLESKSHSVTMGDDFDFEVNLISGRVRTHITREFTQEKSGDVKTFTEFDISYITDLYNVALVINEIVSQEAEFCNSDYLDLMRVNKNIRITKINTGDFNKVYTVSNENTGDVWEFAIRNCVLLTPT